MLFLFSDMHRPNSYQVLVAITTALAVTVRIHFIPPLQRVLGLEQQARKLLLLQVPCPEWADSPAQPRALSPELFLG